MLAVPVIAAVGLLLVDGFVALGLLKRLVMAPCCFFTGSETPPEPLPLGRMPGRGDDEADAGDSGS